MQPTPDADHLAGLALMQARIHAIILLDTEGVIRGWLGGAESIFGYAPDEIIGQKASKLFSQEDVDRNLDRLELEMAQASDEADDDRWQVRKDGARIWASGAMTSLRSETGELVGYLKVLRNRTDNKTHIEALEHRIKMLEESQELRGRSVAALAHELRGPLSSLSMAGGVLKSHPGDDGTAMASEIVATQVELMSQMVANMLEGVGASAGKVELHKCPVVLQDIIGKALASCQPSIDRRKHDLQTLMPEDRVHLTADATRLHQVIVNLLDNAIKYTPDGGKIWVKVTIDGEDAVIKVHDSGVGLSPELQPHIFDLFVQAHSASRLGEGLGIGLSLVKDFVTLHGGTVQALSDGEGKGSIFVVRLPVAEPRSSTPEPEHS
jgi:two-component system CheB/CheR fusion protein